MSGTDDPIRDDDPFRDLGGPVRSVAASLSPPTAHLAAARRRQRRSRSTAAGSLALVAVVLAGVGLASRPGEREITAAGVPTAPSGTGAAGSVPGTGPGTVVDDPDHDVIVISEPDGSLTVRDQRTGATIEVPPTTAAPITDGPDPTTTTTADPGPGADRYEGTYTGVGHYALSGGCPELTQDLDTVLTLADGSTWAYHAAYCGTTDANDVWRGAGPFTITAADGSTLTGDLSSEAQLPTDGVPYGLEITGGSGRFTDASGSCSLTLHLEELAFGVQQNTGTFSCVVTPAPPSSAG